MRPILLACLLAITATGCPDVSIDPGEGPGELGKEPTVEFDPAVSVIPFPNNLALDPATGKVNLAKQCNEGPAQTALRTNGLNKLDGFGTYEVGIQVTFTAPVDMATLAGNIVLYQRTSGTTENPASSAQTIPIVTQVGMTTRFDAACATPLMINAVTIIPMVPLQQKSTYTVAVLKGVKTSDGKDFGPSFTWALVRQTTDPVTLDASGNVIKESTPLDPSGDANGNGIPDLTELRGLDLLWKAHAKALAFLDGTGHSDRSTILLAWEFTTQTTSEPLDPSVTGSIASTLPTTPPLSGITFSVPQARGAPCDTTNGCATFLTASGVPCGPIPCSSVGDILAGAMISPNYQVPTTNPMTGGADIPGAWNDPVHPTTDAGATIQFIAFIPKAPPPTSAGYPLIVFGHGLGSSKESLAVFGPQLARAGFASVAIDFQAHGSRAVRTSKDPAILCLGHCTTTTSMTCDTSATCPSTETCHDVLDRPLIVSPTTTAQCYAPIFSTDLATTRDNIRQTVLDLQRLVLAMKACGAASCTSSNNSSVLAVDGNHIGYAGISLGGIIGSTTTSVAADIKGAVLNVPGVGWGDILENTQTLEIRCLLVDSLIDAGVLTGTKWNKSTTSPMGTCATQDWQTQPGYQQFRAALRWMLDSADGANFTPKLATRKFLIQEVVGDQVVPNIATDREGALVGHTPMTADPFTPATNTASQAITTNATASKWLRYPSLPSTDATTGGFGNLFEHASLLRPAVAAGHCLFTPANVCTQASDCPGAAEPCVFPGSLGTARLQTDAITFLVINH